MKPVDISLMPTDDSLVIMTAEDVAQGVRMQIADFRDLEALVYNPTGNFVGMDRFGVLRLGIRARLVNGIWYADRDPRPELTGQKITETNVSLRIIR